MSSPSKIGRYEVVAELGQGAMGAVYKARDPSMDRTVAIKTILAAALSGSLAAEYRERFTREAKAAGRLAHPGIVTVYDVGEHEGMPYLVMEYVPGRTLAAALESGERFDFDRACELVQQCAEALDYAHRNGVVHRDIKPANILLTAAEHGPERAKVADFGVAKLSATQMTATGQLLGTPSFMPPEQFTGAPVDGRSDIFSLGVILYWMTTGDKPFTGETITSVSYKIVHTDVIAPRRLNPAIPLGLEKIILRCLQKDPALRFQTGAELARALDDLRRGREQTLVAGTPPLAAAFPPGPAPIPSGPPAPTPFASGPTFDSDATQDVFHPQHRPAVPPAAIPSGPVAPAPAAAPARRLELLGVALVLFAFLAVLVFTRTGRAPDSTSKLPAPSAPPPAAEKEPGGTKVAVPGPEVRAKKIEIHPNLPAVPKRPLVDEAEILERVKRETEKANRAWSLAQRQMQSVQEPLPIPAGHLRLRIDASRVPETLNFTVRMDEQPLFERIRKKSAPGPVYQNVFVPAGKHAFRVVLGLGSIRLGSSNTVRGEFTPGEERTLRLALLRGERDAQDTPQHASARSRLVISLE